MPELPQAARLLLVARGAVVLAQPREGLDLAVLVHGALGGGDDTVVWPVSDDVSVVKRWWSTLAANCRAPS